MDRTLDPPLATPAPAQALTHTPPDDRILRADSGQSGDALGTSVPLSHASELAAHARAETPFTIGLFGAAGSGKSHALAGMVERIEALSAGAARSATSPFLSRIRIARVSAPLAKADPESAIVGALQQALSAPGPDGASFAGLVQEAALAATDPHVAARDSADRLDVTRRRLDEERGALEKLENRRARLTESALYDSGASRVDAYARANRGRLEGRLRRFGFKDETIPTYKDLVRDVAEHGSGGRLAAVARSFWSFDGQARLIVSAILLLLLAWGCGVAQDTRETWLASLRAMNDSMQPTADWLQAHIGWFAALKQIALIAAALCLLLNVWRAIRFVSPLLRGARLLAQDVEVRRRELDSALAYQAQRVTLLERDVESHAQRSEQAAKRLAGSAPALPVPDGIPQNAPTKANGFFDALAHTIGREDAPQRLVVAIDDIDALAPAEAAPFLERLHRLLARKGFVTILCTDAATWGASAATLDRLVQIPLSVAGDGGDGDALRAYVRGLLTPGAGVHAPTVVDAEHSVLDAPLRRVEVELLSALTPLAAGSPRRAKRYVNVYRLARARSDDFAPLALMLALDSGASLPERAAMETALTSANEDEALVLSAASPGLGAALAAANAARANPITVGAAQVAWRIARDYRLPV